MIDRLHGCYVLYCDYCGQEADEDFETFDSVVDYKKENGWKSKMTAQGWNDCCPECQEVAE